jgi:hypothetical protein
MAPRVLGEEAVEAEIAGVLPAEDHQDAREEQRRTLER